MKQSIIPSLQKTVRDSIRKARVSGNSSHHYIIKSYCHYKEIELNRNRRGYSILFLSSIDNSIITTNGAKNINGSNIANYGSTIIYSSGRLNTIVHEQGHNLGLQHTFQTGIREHVKKYKTPDNYMDYIETGADKRTHFFRYHVKKTNSTLK